MKRTIRNLMSIMVIGTLFSAFHDEPELGEGTKKLTTPYNKNRNDSYHDFIDPNQPGYQTGNYSNDASKTDDK